MLPELFSMQTHRAQTKLCKIHFFNTLNSVEGTAVGLGVGLIEVFSSGVVWGQVGIV